MTQAELVTCLMEQSLSEEIIKPPPLKVKLQQGDLTERPSLILPCGSRMRGVEGVWWCSYEVII